MNFILDAQLKMRHDKSEQTRHKIAVLVCLVIAV